MRRVNEEYCKWCYTDGKFVYSGLEQLTDFLVEQLSNEQWPAEQARNYFEEYLPKLKHWSKG
ncbi:MAG: zinc ribbon domain-containing protein [Lachnospiraceae bacterium]|nr:zinc ribbon domain-containing protein [Lachnospiraceae bacterium]